LTESAVLSHPFRVLFDVLHLFPRVSRSLRETQPWAVLFIPSGDVVSPLSAETDRNRSLPVAALSTCRTLQTQTAANRKNRVFE
jgi:hypothetical protein